METCFYGVVRLWNERKLKMIKNSRKFFLNYVMFEILFFTLFFTFQSKEKAIVENILHFMESHECCDEETFIIQICFIFHGRIEIFSQLKYN